MLGVASPALSVVLLCPVLLPACGDDDAGGGGSSQPSAPEVSERQAEAAARSAAAGAGFSTINGQQKLDIKCRTLSGAWSCDIKAVKNPECTAIVRIPKQSKQPVSEAKVIKSTETSAVGC